MEHLRVWLGGRDSNPDSQIQSLESYHWTTSQQEEFEFTVRDGGCQPARKTYARSSTPSSLNLPRCLQTAFVTQLVASTCKRGRSCRFDVFSCSAFSTLGEV